jgi:hypothetical protein
MQFKQGFGRTEGWRHGTIRPSLHQVFMIDIKPTVIFPNTVSYQNVGLRPLHRPETKQKCLQRIRVLTTGKRGRNPKGYGFGRPVAIKKKITVTLNRMMNLPKRNL